jgi:glycerophosphoryl diester phosphodiesterase
MMITGHRGAKALEPENTLRALRRGMDCANYVEIDVRMSSDGELVVIHDPTLERTTNGTGRVGDHTLRELRELDAGKGEKIPTLSEVLELTRGSPGLVVEIKEPGTEDRISREVACCRPDRLLIVSFHGESITAISRILPDVATGIIISEKNPVTAEDAQILGAAVVLTKISFLKPAMVTKAHDRGLLVVSWTLNTGKDYSDAQMIGVDGIATDDPCGARHYFSA